MDPSTKDPDTSSKSRRGRGFDSFTVQCGHIVGLQLSVTRIGDDGEMSGETWVLPVEHKSKIEAMLIAFVKEHGVHFAGGEVRMRKGMADEAQRRHDRKKLERGDSLPCEVCGTATQGIPRYPKDGRVAAMLREPDRAGRVWMQDDRIAVCSEPTCLDLWEHRLDEVLHAFHGAPPPNDRE